MIEIQTRVAGIPCLARATYHYHQAPHKGSAHTCDSDMDFYGYDDLAFDVLDQRGRPAPWLERKLTDADNSRIAGELLAAM